MSHPAPPAADLAGRHVVVAVCGGISAYKTAELVSRLVQRSAAVDVVMTAAARKFITPLTFEALSGRPVRTDMFRLRDSSDPQHLALTEQADALIVAPATANIIAKAAAGICDDLVSTMICAAACPVVFCPAMNHRMWENPVTRRNVEALRAAGYRIVGPEEGWLACRHVGMGRMSEPATILQVVEEILRGAGRS